jgi:phage/plasmid-associated DNA primase
MRKGDIAGDSHMEIAQELYAQLSRSSEIRYSEGALHRWIGSMWEKVPEHIVLTHIATEFGHLPAAKRFSDHRGIMSVLHQLAAKTLKVADRPGLNFANGFLDENLELIPHDPDLGMMYCLPYLYRPDQAEHCPQFMQKRINSSTASTAFDGSHAPLERTWIRPELADV